MELMCPHCQQKLTIPDQYAGQLMRCPLCNGTFTAPALSAPPPPVFSMTPEPPPPPPPSPISTEPMQPSSLPPPLPETLPPLAPGEYTRSLKIIFSPRVIPWITPAGLLLVFLLSFMPWGYAIHSEGLVSLNAWNMGFSLNDAVFAIYLILAVLALLLAIPSSLFALGLTPTPPFMQAIGPWRPVIAGGVALLSFLFLLIRYLQFVFHPAALTIWGKLSFRIHLVVIVAVLIEFWLELRRGKNLPPPRLEVRW